MSTTTTSAMAKPPEPQPATTTTTTTTTTVFASEVSVQPLWEKLQDPAFSLKKKMILGRLGLFLAALIGLILSSCYDIPKGKRIPLRVERDGFVIIDAGIITSFFHFPAYVYLTTVACLNLLFALVSLLVLVLEMCLAGRGSDEESIRSNMDSFFPELGLLFDAGGLILSLTAACASMGLTNVLILNLDTTFPNYEELREKLRALFDLKLSASVLMVVAGCFMAFTLALGWKYIEVRKKQMKVLGIPTTGLSRIIDRVFRWYKNVASGFLGPRSEERVVVSPLFVNRVAQVFLSMAAFTCSYLLIEDTEMDDVLERIPAFHVLTWESLAIFIISVVIASVSAIDLALTGGGAAGSGEDGSHETELDQAEYRGIVQSSSAQFKENLIYARFAYDVLASLLTFCVFAASSGVTSAGLNCSAGDPLWCPLSILGVFFVFVLSLSFMLSLTCGSYIALREHRIKNLLASTTTSTSGVKK